MRVTSEVPLVEHSSSGLGEAGDLLRLVGSAGRSALVAGGIKVDDPEVTVQQLKVQERVLERRLCQTQDSAVVGTLPAGIPHDVNNVVTAIDKTPSRPQAAQAASCLRTGGGERLLLVEDEDSIRRMVERGLVRLGYTVLSASTGNEALGLLAASKAAVSLLMTDVRLPGMSGSELAGKVRAQFPRAAVLYASGYPRDHLAEDTAGPDVDFLQKPYTMSAAAARIREMLDRRAAADSPC